MCRITYTNVEMNPTQQSTVADEGKHAAATTTQNFEEKCAAATGTMNNSKPDMKIQNK